MATLAPRPALAFAGLLLAAACSDEGPPAGKSCQTDDQCTGQSICVDEACVSPATLACPDDGSQVAVASVSPAALDLGVVQGAAVSAQLTVENTGACTLRIETWSLEAGVDSRFRCPSCAQAELPLQLAPGRRWDVEVQALPGEEGALTDTLRFQTSDPDRRFLDVPLTAQGSGLAELAVSPSALPFGFAPPGGAVELTAVVVNAGGSPLDVSGAEITGPDAAHFQLQLMRSFPVRVAPARLDPDAKLELRVRYAPPEPGDHSAELVVTAEGGAEVRIPMSGTRAPPELTVARSPVRFGTVRLGESQVQTLALQNTGVAELSLDIAFPPTASADLQVTPAGRLLVPPGGFREVQLRYEPTSPVPVSATLLIASNDPFNPAVSIEVSGTGEAPPPGDEVVSVILEFRSDGTSLFDSDLRDVDLYLESPLGLACSQEDRAPSWGAAGYPQWTGVPGQGNERIVLAGATEDGEYPVVVRYIEDCASLPTALVASILGIATEELVEYASDGEVMIGQERVSEAVSDYCVSRSSASGVVEVRINGMPQQRVNFSLGSAGQFETPITLVRDDGVFSVRL